MAIMTHKKISFQSVDDNFNFLASVPLSLLGLLNDSKARSEMVNP